MELQNETEPTAQQPTPEKEQIATPEPVATSEKQEPDAPQPEAPEEPAPVEEKEEPAPVAEKEEPAPVAEKEAPIAEKEEPASVDKKETKPDEKLQLEIPEGKEEVVSFLEMLVEQPVEQVREAVAKVKAAFYNIRKQELETEKQAFLDKGNEEAAFAPLTDELEEKVKELLAKFKERKAERIAQLEAIRAEALAKKEETLTKLRAIVDDTDNVNRNYALFQQLQKEFKQAGDVAAEHVTRLWREYTKLTENFYDRLKINKELRDYDFKKNLEAKEAIIKEAEAADSDNDVIGSLKKLQALHDKWREIGPVSPDIREELWQRFRDISTSIRKKHQSFFEERKEREKANEEAKTALCERIEALDFSKLSSYKAWDEATNQIKELQAEWKKLGFASPKVNSELFARFRATCDKFFEAKAEYFKKVKGEANENLRKKLELCEAAEALKDSTEWRKTTDQLIELQKKWKEIGTVPKRHSEAVWKRFISACDAFFENKNNTTKNQRETEAANLAAKRDIIAQIEALAENGDPKTAADTLNELRTKWNAVGHVPFKEKDALYEAYQAAVKKVNSAFSLRETRVKLTNFESNVEQMPADSLSRERERLMRAYEQKLNELRTYENNASFFRAKSKAGNSMLQEVERRIARIREDLAVAERKIAMVDEKIKAEKAK